MRRLADSEWWHSRHGGVLTSHDHHVTMFFTWVGNPLVTNRWLVWRSAAAVARRLCPNHTSNLLSHTVGRGWHWHPPLNPAGGANASVCVCMCVCVCLSVSVCVCLSVSLGPSVPPSLTLSLLRPPPLPSPSGSARLRSAARCIAGTWRFSPTRRLLAAGSGEVRQIERLRGRRGECVAALCFGVSFACVSAALSVGRYSAFSARARAARARARPSEAAGLQAARRRGDDAAVKASSHHSCVRP
jgi:hypothetical protein